MKDNWKGEKDFKKEEMKEIIEIKERKKDFCFGGSWWLMSSQQVNNKRTTDNASNHK